MWQNLHIDRILYEAAHLYSMSRLVLKYGEDIWSGHKMAMFWRTKRQAVYDGACVPCTEHLLETAAGRSDTCHCTVSACRPAAGRVSGGGVFGN